MPTIPNPFIGGGQERRRDLSPERHIAQPYVPAGPDRTPEAEPGEASEPEPEPGSAEPEAAEREEVVMGAPEGTSVSGSAESAPTTARRSDSEIPDFLLGPDGTDVGITGTEEGPREAEDDLEATAQDLLAGDLGDRIRSLTRELASEPPEASISKAFAAGYLAGRERE